MSKTKILLELIAWQLGCVMFRSRIAQDRFLRTDLLGCANDLDIYTAATSRAVGIDFTNAAGPVVVFDGSTPMFTNWFFVIQFLV